MELDKQNRNSYRSDAEKKELNQINEYETFIDLGVNGKSDAGYKKIRVTYNIQCES